MYFFCLAVKLSSLVSVDWVRLAFLMETPLRCGGSHYKDGVLIIMLGGKEYNPQELEAYRQKIRDANLAKAEEIDRMTDQEFEWAYPSDKYKWILLIFQ